VSAGHVWKAAMGFPVLVGSGDLFRGAGHEVPPHQDGFGERRATDEQDPTAGRTGSTVTTSLVDFAHVTNNEWRALLYEQLPARGDTTL